MKPLAGETEGAETTTTTTGLWLRVVNCAFRSHCSSSISINLRRFSSLVRTYFGSISSRARQRHLLLRSSPVSEREREEEERASSSQTKFSLSGEVLNLYSVSAKHGMRSPLAAQLTVFQLALGEYCCCCFCSRLSCAESLSLSHFPRTEAVSRIWHLANTIRRVSTLWCAIWQQQLHRAQSRDACVNAARERKDF